MLAGFALSFLLFPPDYPLVSPTPAPWPWRWCDPGTCPSRRCCAGWSPRPCTPPSAPCSSPPWWAPASRPPGAASNSPGVQGGGEGEEEDERTRPAVNNTSCWEALSRRELKSNEHLRGSSCRSRGSTSCRSALHWGSSVSPLGYPSAKTDLC